MRMIGTAALASAALAAAAAFPGAAAAGPTCSGTLDIAVHGQHVVGDYVAGSGHDAVAWPPRGGVGSTVGGSGAAVPGGPGPGFHFAHGVAPGASFCLAQSKSPGAHPGP